jgi:hypothetical protein
MAVVIVASQVISESEPSMIDGAALWTVRR